MAVSIILIVVGLLLLVAGFMRDAAAGGFYLLGLGVVLALLGVSMGRQKMRKRQTPGKSQPPPA